MPVRVLVTILILAASVAAQNDKPKIVLAYPDHEHVVIESIDAFKAEVKKTFPNAIFIEKDAKGDPAEFETTVRAGIAQSPAILVPISTPLSRLAVDQAKGKLPIVFMGVTDPVGAGIVDALERP